MDGLTDVYCVYNYLYVHVCIDGWIDVCMYVGLYYVFINIICRPMYAWTDGWMDGWLGGWIVGWMD